MVNFRRPMDRAPAERLLTVEDPRGQLVAGEVK